jgi:hypothetical protein
MKISEVELQNLKTKYPVGTRIELVEMDDIQSPQPGTLGTVIGVDDIGSLLVRWDNGSGLNLLPEIDHFRKLDTYD